MLLPLSEQHSLHSVKAPRKLYALQFLLRQEFLLQIRQGIRLCLLRLIRQLQRRHLQRLQLAALQAAQIAFAIQLTVIIPKLHLPDKILPARQPSRSQQKLAVRPCVLLLL